MFRKIGEQVWIFDAEWVPDPVTGRVIYALPASLSDEEVVREMWKRGGATPEEPMPFLKTALCRVVVISILVRREKEEEITFHLHSLPLTHDSEKDQGEATVLTAFLDEVGKFRPQLIGYNSQGSDLKIILQRSLVHGIRAEKFVHRKGGRWEEPDYFNRDNDWNVDLMRIIGERGKTTPSLHEIAVACRIPGKINADGEHIATLWLRGEREKIIIYNQYDVLTTYLLWLRLVHFAGFMETEQFRNEEERFREFVLNEAREPKRSHLGHFIETWDHLRGCGMDRNTGDRI
ncbi:MAG TPA: hypothetical protein VLH40_09895 [Atribacteraceae bacterium]|nr:hypothetical protein [Atribacteraceae bacterium]